MPNQIVRPIPITLDRPRTVKCDFNAVIKIRELTGKNLMAGDQPITYRAEVDMEDGNGPQPVYVVDPGNLRAVLFALLLHEDKRLTVDAVGDMLTADNLGEVAAVVVQAINAFVGNSGGSKNGTGDSPRPIEVVPTNVPATGPGTTSN